MEGQREFNPSNHHHDVVITNSPFIVACFRKEDVFLYDDSVQSLTVPDFETYGAGFDVLMKQLHGIQSLLPQLVVDEIRTNLKYSDGTVTKDEADARTLTLINTMGLSMEKAYLLRKLAPNKDAS